MIGPVIPWNEEAELNILGILLYPDTDAAAVMDRLTVEEHLSSADFYGDINRKVFEAVKSLCESDTAVDFATVANAMNCTAEDTEFGVLKRIASSMPIRTALSHYAKIVKDLSRRRDYIAMAQKVISLASNTTQPFDSINSEIEHTITQCDNKYKMKCAKDCLIDIYGDIVDNVSNPNKLAGAPTEWHGINKLTGGLKKGEFIIIGGRPGMGKSVAGQNIAEHIAFNENKKALVFTMEMPEEQLTRRILSSKANIAHEKFKSGDVIDDDFLKLGWAMENKGFENIMIMDEPHMNVNRIKAMCRAEKRRYKELGVVIIDYLGLMQLPQKSKSRWEGISEISRELKLLAKELDCPVVALCQLNREVEREREKRPTLSDLRDSGSLEQDADVVILLYRDEYYHPESRDKGIIEMILAKVRDGKTGTVKLAWQPHIMRIMEPQEVTRLKKLAEEQKRKKYGEQSNIEEVSK